MDPVVVSGKYIMKVAPRAYLDVYDIVYEDIGYRYLAFCEEGGTLDLSAVVDDDVPSLSSPYQNCTSLSKTFYAVISSCGIAL